VRRTIQSAVAVALTLSLLACPAFAATPKDTQYIDKADGFSIVIPSKWVLVPRTVAQTRVYAASIKKKQPGLAAAYLNFANNIPTEITAFVFQAFVYEANAVIQPEVLVGVVKTSRVYTAVDLPGVGATYAAELAKNKGAKLSAPRVVTMPAGKAAFITGTIPAGVVSRGLDLFLIPHGKKLYELEFIIDAQYLSQASIFGEIADSFRFV